jgi:ABC-type nickel/cobalt efflux system permease component RcnA
MTRTQSLSFLLAGVITIALWGCVSEVQKQQQSPSQPRNEQPQPQHTQATIKEVEEEDECCCEREDLPSSLHRSREHEEARRQEQRHWENGNQKK